MQRQVWIMTGFAIGAALGGGVAAILFPLHGRNPLLFLYVAAPMGTVGALMSGYFFTNSLLRSRGRQLLIWIMAGVAVGAVLGAGSGAVLFLLNDHLPVMFLYGSVYTAAFGALMSSGFFASKVLRHGRGPRASEPQTARHPWVAVVLQWVPAPLGLGYVYLGRPRRFVAGLLGLMIAGLLAVGIGFVGAFSCSFGAVCSTADLVLRGFAAPLPVVALLGAMSWDAWHLAHLERAALDA